MTRKAVHGGRSGEHACGSGLVDSTLFDDSQGAVSGQWRRMHGRLRRGNLRHSHRPRSAGQCLHRRMDGGCQHGHKLAPVSTEHAACLEHLLRRRSYLRGRRRWSRGGRERQCIRRWGDACRRLPPRSPAFTRPSATRSRLPVTATRRLLHQARPLCLSWPLVVNREIFKKHPLHGRLSLAR